MKTKTIGKIIPLILIFVLAVFVRLYNINFVPSGVYPDEAVNGIDALKTFYSGNYKWFYTDNNGREGLFMNLIALSYHLFGISILGLKFPSIVFGSLSVLGSYFLTKELFRSHRAGLLVAFFIATSFWSINFSRIAFRAIMLPTILTFSFYFLFRGIRNNKSFKLEKIKQFFYFSLSGFIFGVGLHTYIAFRIAPAILFILFVALWITKKNFLKDYWLPGLFFIIFSIISMSPMLLDFYHHPEHLTSRSGEISIFSSAMNHGHFLKTAGKSLGLSLVKYSFWGDQNWRHNYPPYPILNPLLGVAFLIGLIYIISKWFHLLFLRFKHNIRDRKFYVYSFLLAWFFGMLSPEFLSAEGLPHALRAIGTLPPTYMIVAIPFLWTFGKIDNLKNQHGFRSIVISSIFIILLFIGVSNIIKYHYFWAKNKHQAIAFESSLMNVSDYLKTLPKNKKKIIIAGNMQIIPIKLFNYKMPNTYRIHPDNLNHITSKLPKSFSDGYIFILTDNQKWIVDKLINTYPNLKFKKFKKVINEQPQTIWTVQK